MDRGHSIFRDYVEDSPESLGKLLDSDMRHSKIDCLVEEGGDQAIKEFLSKHYARIISIFDYYAGISSYPFISAHNLIDFARETKIIDDEVISETSFKRLVEETIG